MSVDGRAAKVSGCNPDQSGSTPDRRSTFSSDTLNLKTGTNYLEGAMLDLPPFGVWVPIGNGEWVEVFP